MDSKLLIVCGPTASGKTALALRLAKKYNGELVSADSRQVYRGMDIATGKDLPVDVKIQKSKLKSFFKNKQYRLGAYVIDTIPLWMIDVVSPDEEFSVTHYRQLAASVIADIEKRGKLPIVVGGTGLYITSLLSPFETSHIPPNKKLRDQLQRLHLTDLQEKLKNVNPPAWNAMNESDRHNPRRLVRKIEMTEYYFRHPEPDVSAGEGSRPDKKGHDALLISLSAPNTVLYERIDERVDKRVKQGIIEEITHLLQKGYTWDLPSMNTFGYKEWREYFEMPNAKCQMINRNRLFKDIIQRWKWDEHGYARRQMTWFRKMKGIQWTDITESRWLEKVETVVEEWYTNRN